MARLAGILTAARTGAEGQVSQTLDLADQLWRKNLTGLRGLTSLAVAEVRSAGLVTALGRVDPACWDTPLKVPGPTGSKPLTLSQNTLRLARPACIKDTRTATAAA